MRSDNLLCDLESDIDKDWIEIHNSIQKKEIEEKVDKEIDDLKNNPLRMNFPHFAEFYETMFCIYQSYLHHEIEISYDMSKMLDHMFYRYGSDAKMSPAFDYVWAMFCDPSKYAFHTFRCNHCNKKWDVVFNIRDNRRFDSYGYINYEPNRTIELHRVRCPDCSNIVGNLSNELLGIFRHKELSKDDILDREEYRKFLREGGYDIR